MLNDDLRNALFGLRESILERVSYRVDGDALVVSYGDNACTLKLNIGIDDVESDIQAGDEVELLKRLSDNPEFFDGMPAVLLADIATTYGEAISVLQGTELKK